MQYKDFTLDPFQVESINAIEANNSVVVSAATGTGKTLIADYVIDKAMKEGKRVFYTAPIKALSNQKYKDFKKEYGEERVGIMTGDLVINPEADVIVMTTEIYRNMLMVNDPIVNLISYIVFDEIHFINDIERGVVWEESIIFSPEHVRFLCLSATIPNAREFADWIESIKNQCVEVVEYNKRAVPLKHWVYEKEVGMVSAEKLKQSMELNDIPDFKYMKGKQKKRRKFDLPASHIDVVREIKDQTPAIFFTFSRKACEIKAKELWKKIDLTTSQEKHKIVEIWNQHINKDIKPLISTQRLRKVIGKGIAFHHAGMLPNLKEIVEILFGMGLIKVLYATETFAVGINMPAKTVCFNTMQKYDGISFRYLNSKEYFQMAGRAGRRGIDDEGTAIVLVNRATDDIDKIMKVSSKDVDPIVSQFKLCINTVINLINNYDSQEQIDQVLKSNFDYFLRTKGNKKVNIMNSWKAKLRFLTRLGYLNEEGQLTQKGGFTRYIYSYEIPISELFSQGLHEKLDIKETILAIIAIAYEPRRGKRFYKTRTTLALADGVFRKLSTNDYLKRNINPKVLRSWGPIVSAWVDGCPFEELMQYSNLEEGDYIRIFRQAIDVFRQLKKAALDPNLLDEDLIDKCKAAIDRIDRDVIKVEF